MLAGPPLQGIGPIGIRHAREAAARRRAGLNSEANRLVSRSIADSSARTFEPGIAAYREFCHTHDVISASPSAEDIILFATYLGHSRSVSTVKVYLAAVRHHLMSQAASIDCLHSTRLAAVLRGMERSQRPAMSSRRGITTANLQILETTPWCGVWPSS